MQTLHVIMNQQHLEPKRLPGKVSVVLDVVFATTTVAMALAEGVREVVAVPEVEDARQYAAHDTILAGEKDAVVPAGFEHFAPTVLARAPLLAKRLVLVTTNGTVALANSVGSAHVYTAALVNAGAVCRRLLEQHREETVLLVCSASRHRFNIEDFVGAGHLVSRLASAAPRRFALTDAALAARHLAETCDIRSVVHDSRVGRMMGSMGLSADLDFAVKIDRYDVVPRYSGNRIRVDTG